MSLALYVSETVGGGGRLYDTTTLSQIVATFGSGVLPSIDLSFQNGTGSGYANQWYLARRTLAATTYDLLDLAGGLTQYDGSTITFTKIKRVLIALVSPDGTAKLRIGPQGQSNPFTGPWGGTGATVYREVIHKDDMTHPYAGWTVTAGTGDILPIYNPTGSSIVYAIWIIGES